MVFLPSVLVLMVGAELLAGGLNRAVRSAENFEPAIPHPEQEKDAGQHGATGVKQFASMILIVDPSLGQVSHFCDQAEATQILTRWLIDAAAGTNGDSDDASPQSDAPSIHR